MQWFVTNRIFCMVDTTLAWLFLSSSYQHTLGWNKMNELMIITLRLPSIRLVLLMVVMVEQLFAGNEVKELNHPWKLIKANLFYFAFDTRRDASHWSGQAACASGLERDVPGALPGYPRPAAANTAVVHRYARLRCDDVRKRHRSDADLQKRPRWRHGNHHLHCPQSGRPRHP